MACQLRNSWKCTVCQAIFTHLPVLVGHIRASHSNCGHSFECGINDCKLSFRSTATFYKHVRSIHAEVYHGDPHIMKSPQNNDREMESSQFESTTDHSSFTSNCDDHDLDTVTIDAIDITNSSPRVDITRVATEHLLKLKQRPGVTESLLKEVVEMNQALIRGVIMNAASDIEELESTDTALVISKLSEHANSLDCLSTNYSINATMKLNFPTAVSYFMQHYAMAILVATSYDSVK